MFLHLLINPLRDSLSALPCARCDNYYLKKRKNQKVYCTKRCGSLATAQKATYERLSEERAAKLNRAKTLARQWETAHTRQDWKTWIYSHSRKTITPKWLTIAVKNYGLKSPRKRRTHNGKTQQEA